MSEPESGVSPENVVAGSKDTQDGRGALSKVTAYLFSPAFPLIVKVPWSKLNLKLVDRQNDSEFGTEYSPNLSICSVSVLAT